MTEESPAAAGQSDQQPYQQPYPQPSPGQYQQPYPAYGYAGRPTNTLAVVSLIASIAGVTVLPVVASITGVITGTMARRQIRATGEGGDGMALAGVVVGWVGVGIAAIGIVLVVLMLAGVAVFGFAAGGAS